MGEIFNVIADIQRECPLLEKDSQGYGYQYTSLGKLWETIKPLFVKHDIAWSAYTRTQIIDGQPYSELHVIIYTIANHDDFVESVYTYQMTQPQKIGSAETYYRRYALIKMLGLIPADDDGMEASTSYKKAPPTPSVSFE